MIKLADAPKKVILMAEERRTKLQIRSSGILVGVESTTLLPHTVVPRRYFYSDHTSNMFRRKVPLISP